MELQYGAPERRAVTVLEAKRGDRERKVSIHQVIILNYFVDEILY